MYGPDELLKLSQIVMLRQLGLSLEEIKQHISQQGDSLEHFIQKQIHQLKAQIDGQKRLLSRLQTVAKQLQEKHDISMDALAQLMEAIKMVEKYYTSEQLEQLKQRYEDIGEEKIQQVQEEWKQVFQGFQQALEQKRPVESTETQTLVQQYNALIAAFTGGDQCIHQSLQNMYQQGDGAQMLEQHGYGTSPALFAYIQQAQQAAKG
tara:strand:+ start:19236 stop:19853 length:618 start_codon:yes stop_codon:yes gene_type:complete